VATTSIRPPLVSAKSLVGQRFGRYTAIAYEGRRDKVTCLILCVCDCGTIRSVAAGDLRSGHSKSCGCLKREMVAAIKRTHGHTVGRKPSPEYAAWVHMISRCENPKDDRYKNYGGRGITIDASMRTFDGFIAHMGPANGLTLERRDVNGNYEPDNMLWVKKSLQMRNKQCTVHLTYKGRHIILNDAREHGLIDSATYYKFRRKGMSEQNAFDAAVSVYTTNCPEWLRASHSEDSAPPTAPAGP
jgi:hypothetical protein